MREPLYGTIDGVQIHAAHGYLLSQFLTPHTNRRTPRRYHGCVVLGADSRAAMAAILASRQVVGVVADQHTVMTAVHAITVEHTEPVIRTGPLARR